MPGLRLLWRRNRRQALGLRVVLLERISDLFR